MPPSSLYSILMGQDPGFRARQNLMAMCLGMCNAGEAAEVVVLGFILAEMDDDLDFAEKSLLSSAVFF